MINRIVRLLEDIGFLIKNVEDDRITLFPPKLYEEYVAETTTVIITPDDEDVYNSLKTLLINVGSPIVLKNGTIHITDHESIIKFITGRILRRYNLIDYPSPPIVDLSKIENPDDLKKIESFYEGRPDLYYNHLRFLIEAKRRIPNSHIVLRGMWSDIEMELHLPRNISLDRGNEIVGKIEAEFRAAGIDIKGLDLTIIPYDES